MPELGRPTTYTPEIAQRICELISSDSRGLAHICNENEDMPCRSTVYLWLSQHSDFSDKYARAKEAQCHVLADEILDISDSSKDDWVKRLAYKGPVEDWELNGESIHRSRLRVESRKWLLSKLLPKKYGDNQQVDMSGQIKIDRNITVTYVNPPVLQGPRNPPATYQPAIEAEAVEIEDAEFIDEWEDAG